VVAYHLGFRWARGGYLGVDTFLVLSGYLITSLLLSEHRQTLLSFWARRARRLLPALVVLLAAVAIYGATMALPDEARQLRLDSASAFGFVSNWRFILTGQGYFGQSAAPSLLRHTWSLAVEGQLYLIWPLVVIGALRRGGPRRLTILASALAAISTALAIVLVPDASHITRAYYGTDTRAAAFFIGGALASSTVMSNRRSGKLGLAGAIGMLTTAVLWTTLSGTSRWLFRGGLPLAALATAALIATTVHHPSGVLNRVLSVGPLRLLGRVSYGIYLWHWPLVLVLTEGRTGLSGAGLLAARLGAIAAATAASWVLVERPFLTRATRRRHRGHALAGATGLCVIAATLSPLAGRTAAAGQSAPSAAAQPAHQPTKAIVLGDSVAFTLARGMANTAARFDVVLNNEAMVGCGVAVGTAVRSLGQVSQIPGACPAWEQHWQASVDTHRPQIAIILLGRWELLDRLIADNPRWQHIGQPAFDAYVADRLDRAITIAGSRGARVIICTAPYFSGIERPGGGLWPENDPKRVDRYNQLVRLAVSRHPAVVLFDLHALLSPGRHFGSVVGGRAVRSSDGVHFSPDGGAYVGAALLPHLTGR
jgi:peptidoglycan/LPS O-acetylase OafA/YrhL